jgi:hypothetical protein
VAVRWPSTLPQFMSVDGYTEGLSDGRLVLPMDAGPPKIRRRTTAAIRPVSVSSQMPVGQKERFRRWWEEDTEGGTAVFEFPDQALSGRRLLSTAGDKSVLRSTGTYLLIRRWWLCHFGEGVPTITSAGVDLWNVSFNLLVLRRKV